MAFEMHSLTVEEDGRGALVCVTVEPEFGGSGCTVDHSFDISLQLEPDTASESPLDVFFLGFM